MKWTRALIGVALVLVLAVGFCIFTLQGTMYHYDKVIWGDVQDFRCQVGRWPKDSNELIEKATPESRPVLQQDLGRFGGVHFSNENQNLASRSIQIRFESSSGYFDNQRFDFEQGACQAPPYMIEFKK
jgi:hypothetical protein